MSTPDASAHDVSGYQKDNRKYSELREVMKEIITSAAGGFVGTAAAVAGGLSAVNHAVY